MKIARKSHSKRPGEGQRLHFHASAHLNTPWILKTWGSKVISPYSSLENHQKKLIA